jgi:glycosyltransferase involved in cell wall biosynthesis
VPLVYVEHARNFGEHNAVMTGLRRARGRYVITMDDDLQNPPEEVLHLYDHARLGGWDVVYTRYAEKKHEGWRNLGSRFANWVADQLMDKPKGLYLSSFRCMSALVVHEVAEIHRPLSLYRRPDHAGDAAHRQHRGDAPGPRRRPQQLHAAPADPAVAEPRHQLLAAAAALAMLAGAAMGSWASSAPSSRSSRP